jgi:hypothetical protein
MSDLRRAQYALIIIALALPAAAGNRMFLNARTFGGGFAATVDLVRAGDFDHDGRNDVLLVSGDTMRVYRGDGAGFLGGAIPTVATGFKALGVADFNGDGIPDLYGKSAAADATFGVMLGRGDGTFAGASTVTAPETVLAVVPGDFNADGKQDLAVCTANKLALYLGNNAGGFGAPFLTAHGFFSAANGAAGDFDGDGRLDVLFGSPNLTPFYYNGDTTFTAGSPVIPVVSGPANVAADFDGDGVADVSSGTVIRFGLRNRQFAAPQKLPVVNGSSPAARDLDADGKPELLTMGGITLVDIFRSTATGVMNPPRTFAVGPSVTGVDAADFDGDGKPDLVAAGRSTYYATTDPVTISLVHGNGDGTFRAPIGIDVGAALGASGYYYFQGGFHDNNGDGRKDILSAVSQSSTVFVLGTLFASPSGGYEAPVLTIVPPSSSTDMMDAFYAGDTNGDGRGDMVVQRRTDYSVAARFFLYLGNADGTFTASYSWVPPNGARVKAVADVNGDGLYDVLDNNGKAYPGNGAGSFGAPLDDTFPEVPYITDLNADGRPDRLWTSSQTIYARLANADGTFAPAVTTPGNGITAVGDFNEDGFPDLVVSDFMQLGHGDGKFDDYYSGGVPAGYNLTAGGPPPEAPVPAALIAGSRATSPPPLGMAWDFDGDGHVDAADGAAILYGNGSGSFGHFNDYANFRSNTSSFQFLADVLGDAKPELVLRNDDSTLTFLEPASQPTGALQSTITLTPALNPGPARKWLGIDAMVSGPSGLLPTGWVHFMLGPTDIGIHPVDKEGKVHVSGNFLVGDYTITADYLGDDHLVPASASFVQNVVPTATITKVSAFQTKLQIGQAVLLHGETIHAAGGLSPTGNVTLKKGSTVLGTVKNFPNSATYLSINDATIFPIGTHTVTAEWTGDANYLASASQPLTITITKVIPQMTVTRPAGTIFVGQTATFSAAFPNRTDVTGTVTFTLGGTLLGTAAVSNAAASVTVPVPRYGLYLPVVAEYSGSAQYEPNSASTTLDVYGGNFSDGPPRVKALLTPASTGGGWDVSLAITPLIGATAYDVYRSTGAGSFTLWRTYYADSPWYWSGDVLAAGDARIYQVIARDGAGHSTLGSAPAIALGMTFGDDPLAGGTTLIKAAHLAELRIGINAVRRAAGLPAATFSTIAAGSLIHASDLAEVRQALTQARTAVGLATPLTDPSLAAAMLVRAAHVQELRNAMR